MWNLPKGKDFLQATSVKKLEQCYEKEKNAKSKVRLLCAINRKRGKSIDEIAYMTSLPRRTVHGCLHRFTQRGLSAHKSVKQSGRPPQLTTSQRRKLFCELERGPPHNPSGLWSTKEVRELIQKKFLVKYAPQHVWRLLVTCGFSLQRPRPHHYKAASPDEIIRFKKKRDAKQLLIERKDLLWALKTKQHLGSSQLSRVVGHAKEAGQLQT